jgi:hypothetical protein
MLRLVWKLIVTLALIVSIPVLVLADGAEQVSRIQDIRAIPKSFVNEMVTVEGFATQLVPSETSTTNVYVLKDDYGGVIKVRTSKEHAVVGMRYRVHGVVEEDATAGNELFISEQSRVDISAASPAGGANPAPASTEPQKEAQSTSWFLSPLGIGLLTGVAAVSILIAVLAFSLARSRDRQPAAAAADLSDLTMGQTPASQTIEGRTIKIHAPPQGTLKILPGRLEVVSGDDTVKEIRFYRVNGHAVPEITFGRLPGPPYTHVQLKPMTVSGRQAKMSLKDGGWVITNFAPGTSNPTRHNTTEMAPEAQAHLREGDQIQMGEVVFAYREA